MKSEYRMSLGNSTGKHIWMCGEQKNVVNLWEVGRAGTWGTDGSCETINGNINVGWKGGTGQRNGCRKVRNAPLEMAFLLAH